MNSPPISLSALQRGGEFVCYNMPLCLNGLYKTCHYVTFIDLEQSLKPCMRKQNYFKLKL